MAVRSGASERSTLPLRRGPYLPELSRRHPAAREMLSPPDMKFRLAIRSALAIRFAVRHALADRALARRTNVEAAARALLSTWRTPAPLAPIAIIG